MHDLKRCTCAEHCLMYVHTRKHHFEYHSSSFACVECCVVFVLALKCWFVHDRCQCAYQEGCVAYVPALKCQFVHFQGPFACIVKCPTLDGVNLQVQLTLPAVRLTYAC